MALTSAQKQKAHRERLATQGIVPVSLELPADLVARVTAEAKASGSTRSQVIAQKLATAKAPRSASSSSANACAEDAAWQIPPRAEALRAACDRLIRLAEQTRWTGEPLKGRVPWNDVRDIGKALRQALPSWSEFDALADHLSRLSFTATTHKPTQRRRRKA